MKPVYESDLCHDNREGRSLLSLGFTKDLNQGAFLPPFKRSSIRFFNGICFFGGTLDEAKPGLVFFSVATTLSYLILGMGLTVGAAGLFLFKASRLLCHSSRDGFRSIRQRRFWLIGFGRFESASRFCNAFDELCNYRKSQTRG